MLDPSRFSPAYDHELVSGLEQSLKKESALKKRISQKNKFIRNKIILFSRRKRPGEKECIQSNHEMDFFKKSSSSHEKSVQAQEVPFFYFLSERFFSDKTSKLFKIIKGIEHIIDAARFVVCCLLKRPDIIHFQWVVLPVVDIWVIRILKILKFRLVITLHDNQMFLGAASSKWQSLCWDKIPLLFDKIIVHTQSAKDIWINFLGKSYESRIFVIPHGPLYFAGESSKDFQQNSREIRKSKFEKKSDEKRIMLIFGVIKFYKGHDLLFKAFSKLPENLKKNWQIHIVGHPFHSTSELKKIARELKIDSHIIWDERFVEDHEIPNIAKSADLFVFPYRNIDASGVLMGFMKYHKPIVASKLGVFKDLLENQEAAFLCVPEDIQALSLTLVKAIEFDASNFRWPNGLMSSWEEIAGKTIDVYSSCIRA